MKISELQPKQGKVDIIAEVISMEQPREFNKFGKSGKVCNAIIKDDSGQVKLTLWNDDVDKIKVGMKIHIENGYVNEWQGEMQLTTGKFGKLEILEESSQVKQGKKEETPKTFPEEEQISETQDPYDEADQEDLDIEEESI